MSVEVKLNHAGIAALLKSSELQALVTGAADEVAANVRGLGITVGDFTGPGEIPLPVEVSTTVTDRAHARVTIAHPAGVAVQAKHGALTQAAAAAGLDVQ